MDTNDTPTKMRMVLETEEQTQLLGEVIASVIESPMNCFLKGDLGVGKTRLVRAIIQSLGFKGNVKSPTYTIVEPYQIGKLLIHHFDLYRLSDPEELDFLGIRDYFDQASINFFEWPEKGEGWLEQPDLIIDMTFHERTRICNLTGQFDSGKLFMKKLKKII